MGPPEDGTSHPAHLLAISPCCRPPAFTCFLLISLTCRSCLHNPVCPGTGGDEHGMEAFSLPLPSLWLQLLVSFPGPSFTVYSTGLQCEICTTQPLNTKCIYGSPCGRLRARSFHIRHKSLKTGTPSPSRSCGSRQGALNNLPKGPAHPVLQSEFGTQLLRFKSTAQPPLR